MDKLHLPAQVRPGFQVSRPVSAAPAVATTNFSADRLPPIMNRAADIAIPNGAWSHWTPESGARELRRALTAEERGMLEARASQLKPALHPYCPADVDAVALAIADVFGSYTSMRQTDGEAAARIDSCCRALEFFPAWAIIKVCGAIQSRGVLRDGKYDRRWPPNDSEIIQAIEEELRHYIRCYRSAVALLSASVEER